MTLPNVERLWLMADPSLSLSPVAPVESARSLPAKSTRLIWLLLVVLWPRLFLYTWRQTGTSRMVNDTWYISRNDEDTDTFRSDQYNWTPKLPGSTNTTRHRQYLFNQIYLWDTVHNLIDTSRNNVLNQTLTLLGMRHPGTVNSRNVTIR